MSSLGRGNGGIGHAGMEGQDNMGDRMPSNCNLELAGLQTTRENCSGFIRLTGKRCNGKRTLKIRSGRRVVV